MNSSENPYASPSADLTAPLIINPEMASAEIIRRKYLSHEASVQSIGILYWLGSIFMFIASFVLLFVTLTGKSNPFIELIFIPIYLGLAVLSLWLGYGFRKLDSRVRIPAGILSALGLLGFPMGTLINAYILYLLFCAKGKMVFSPEYKDIIRQTPHIKYRTSWIVWVLLFILLAFLAFAMIGFFVQGI
jgi:hypothetical protein